MAEQQLQRGRIRELDGWRGVSILLVLLYHSVIYAFPAVAARSKTASRMATDLGELGVQIFFVISGFVITRLLIKEESQTGAISLKAFYIRRIFRILPVFFLLVSTVALLGELGLTPISLKMVLLSALFLRDADISRDWFLGHTWSLAVEEQFYILFPLFWVFASPRRRPAILGVSLLCFLIWGVFSEWNLLTGLIFRSAILGFGCINLGVLLAVFETRVRGLMARIPPLVPLLAAAFLFLGPVRNTPLGRACFHPLVPFCIGLVLAYTFCRPGWASSLLKSPVLQWIGLVSYSGYLWQSLFTGHVSFYGSPAIASGFHLALPCLILVAAISYYGVERPFTRLGRRFSGKGNSTKSASELVPS